MSRSSIERMYKAGALPIVRIGHRVLIPQASIEQLTTPSNDI